MKPTRLFALIASLLPLALFAQTSPESATAEEDTDVVHLGVYEVNSVPLVAP